jgi:hypothetical protein
MAWKVAQHTAAFGDRQLVACGQWVRIYMVAADVAAGGAAGDMQLRTGGPNGDPISPTLRSGGASTTTFAAGLPTDGTFSDGIFIDIGTAGTGITWWIWYDEVRRP